jgi:hypothetical protein
MSAVRQLWRVIHAALHDLPGHPPIGLPPPQGENFLKFLRTTLIFFVIVAAFALFMHYYYKIDRQATARQIETYYDLAYAGKAAITCKHIGIISGGRAKFNWLTEVTFVSNRDTVLTDPASGKIELKKNTPLTFPATFVFSRDSGGKWRNIQILPGIVK